MADGTRVGENVNSSLLVLRHSNRDRQKVGQKRIGVGNVDDFGVGQNLGHEAARVEVGGDGHTET